MDSKIQFRDASPPPSAWAPSFDGEWWLLEPSQQLYWFAEADDYSDDTAAPTFDRPQLGRSPETAAYVARNTKFESTLLQRRVNYELGISRPLTFPSSSPRGIWVRIDPLPFA
jgi:hypothetical protein